MIRRATKEDAARIAEIHIFAWRKAYRGIISDDYLFTKILVSDRMSDFIKTNEDEIHELYVFEENKIIKGFMKIGLCRNEDKKESFELWGLYVEPLMQGLGVGTKLLDHCEKLALERGFNENILWVLNDNVKSRKFYEERGYIVEGKQEFMENINAKEIRYSKKIN